MSETKTIDPITIVSGMPRCGSSLTMQMLAATGMPCAGSFPDFEPADGARSKTAEEMEAMKGKAFKFLDPHRLTLPEGFSYRVIFLTRSRQQQALSQMKVMRIMKMITGKLTDAQIASYESDLRTAEKQCLDALQRHECRIIKVRFEDLIARTNLEVNRIAWFLGLGSEADKSMERCVYPRSVSCYPGILEIDLMAERDQREAEEGEA